MGRAAGFARQAVEVWQPCKIALVVRLLAFAGVAAPVVKRLLRRLSQGSKNFMQKKPLQCYTLSTQLGGVSVAVLFIRCELRQ
jgi:H+/Cl- antiporter ClcA